LKIITIAIASIAGPFARGMYKPVDEDAVSKGSIKSLNREKTSLYAVLKAARKSDPFHPRKPTRTTQSTSLAPHEICLFEICGGVVAPVLFWWRV